MPLLTLVLASASPRRSDLLRGAGYRFDVDPSGAEELDDPNLAPEVLVTQNAVIKGLEVARRRPADLVLAADTLVYLDGEPLGKPVNIDQAATMIGRLSGRAHQVATGVSLAVFGQGFALEFCDITEVVFKSLTSGEIAEYLQQINPLDKAGGYAAQDHGECIIEKIIGSKTNVIGLPMEMLTEKLLSEGFRDYVPAELGGV